MAKKDAPAVPAKLTVKAGGKAPSTPDQHVVHAAKAISQSSGEGFVRRGQITLYLTTVAKVAETADEAKAWIADAFDAGLLKDFNAGKKAAA